MKISILLLAAGQSSRMGGRDKLLESLGGRPLIAVQVQRALATGYPVYVTLPHAQHPRGTHLQRTGVTCIGVPNATDGVAVSLRAGLAVIPPHHAVLIHLPDLVDIDVDDLQSVLRAPQNNGYAAAWRAATTDGAPGHPILISAQLRAEFAQLTGDSGGAAILKRHKDSVHLVRLPGQRARLDLDTPEDWAAWRAANPAK